MASPSSSSSKKPVGKWKGSIASSDLRSFFVPAQKQKTAASVETKVDEVYSSSSQDTHTQPASASATTVLQDVQTSHDASTTSAKSLDLSESRPPSVEFSDEIDIGIFVGPGKKRPHDNKIVELLERSWKPPSDYKFPFSTHKKGGMDERRFVRKEHLEKYPWLVISPSCKGLFCKFCPFFAKSSAVSGKTYNMKTLVMEPLKKFAKLLGREGDLEHHQNTAYHKEAVLLAADFLENQKNREDQIANKLDNYRLEKIKENRETLKLILQNVIFLGRQNITFRGHRDDGPISIEEPPMRNEGNFRALLRFRCEVGDSALKTHLETASLRNKLTSKTVQNALIECCGQDILGTIVKRIKESEFFSVVFDETTDISHISQLSMVIRYVFDKDIREDFIGFLNVREAAVNLSIEKEDDFETDEEESVEGRGRDETNEAIEPSVTGIKLGQIVLDEICNLGLDLKKCVGIGTDGCSTNVSLAVGAIQEIQKVASNAVRCPCYNHNLNLIISKTTQVQAVRNAYGILSEVIAFFRASSKRNLVLKNVLGQQLKKLCETRWVERHDSVLQFVVNIEKISSALEEISGWENEDSSAQKAHSYMCSLRDGSFLVSLYSLSEILGVTCNLSKLLQTENLDIQSASDAVFAVKSVLEGKRRNVDHNFDDIFSKASSMIEILGGEIKVPRTAHRQTCRSNVPFQSAKEYFRQSVYIPLLDWVLDDFSTRFSEDVLDIYRVNLFLPQAIVAKSTVSVPSKDIDHDISIICKKYCELFGVHNEMLTLQLKAEYEQWQVKWNRDIENGKNIPLTTLDVYNQCHPILFPLIKRLLHVMLTLPVSIASAERSFSTLRTLKTYLRSRCGENRLNGLAMLYIHRDIIVDEENVINKFSMMKENRKHNFLL